MLDPPLPVATWTKVLLPSAAQQHTEKLVVPLAGVCCPWPFHAAGEGVLALASATLADPGMRGILRRWLPWAQRACAMCFAERVATSDECDCLAVVHAHPAKGISDVMRTACRIGVRRPLAIITEDNRSFGVEVDQPHSGAAEGLRAQAVHLARGQLLLLWAGAQIQAIRAIGRVQTPCAIFGDGATHALDGCSSRESEEVTPAQAVPVLLLDRPEEGPCLVQVRVIGPAPLRFKALAAAGAAPMAVRVAVGARAVPGQADEEGAIVAIVRRPAVLRVRH
mmetsp:Transcript_122567/g.357927  ORF Transcript_122567/g.357927 Transcript_122567/m.357927 type:complete len:280 (-) Transcript_122567:236-1075(-)